MHWTYFIIWSAIESFMLTYDDWELGSVSALAFTL